MSQVSRQPAAVLTELIRSGASVEAIDQEILRQARELAATQSSTGRLTPSLLREKRPRLYAVITGEYPPDGRRVTSFTSVQQLIDAVGTVATQRREVRRVARTREPARRVSSLGSTPEEVRARVFERFRYYDQTSQGRELRVRRMRQLFKPLIRHLEQHLRNPAVPCPWQPLVGSQLTDPVDRLVEAALADYRQVYPTPEHTAGAAADAAGDEPGGQPAGAQQTERSAAPRSRQPERSAAGGTDAPGEPARPAPAAPAAGYRQGINLQEILARVEQNRPQVVINGGDPRYEFRGPFWVVMIGAGGVGLHFARDAVAEVKIANMEGARQATIALRRAAGMNVEGTVQLGQTPPANWLPHRISVYDGDRFEEKNLGRQHCNRFAVEQRLHKAVLVEALAKAQLMEGEPSWLVQVSAHPEYIESVEHLERIIDQIPEQYTPLIIDTVDNFATRKLIDRYFRYRARRKLLWISAGNKSVEDPLTGRMRHYGQVVLAARTAEEQILPTLFDWEPELLQHEDLLPSQVSCGDAAVHIHQTRHLNTECAVRIRNFFLDLLHGNPIDYARINFDVDAGWEKLKPTEEVLSYVGRADVLRRARARQAM